MKRFLCLLLALVMALSLAACGAQPQTAEPSPAPETAQQPAETAAPEAEKSGDIVILYTSDVHCGIDKGFGYAGLQQVRDYLLSQGDEVILVDNGDSIQGEPVGTMTRGEALIDLMNQMGYSVAIPGNHEFDYGMDQFLSMTEKAQFDYISCNFNKAGELLFPAYVIRELAGHKVGFVGVTTPQSLTSSTPAYFQDENGDFLYGFFQDEDGHGVYDAVQKAADDVRAEGAEYVVVMAHAGNGEAFSPWNYADIITHTHGIDAFLDGHSHDTDQVKVKNDQGVEVPRSACGTQLEAIGWCRISADGNVSTGLYTWNNKVSAPALLGIDNEMGQAVAAANDALQEKLNEVVAASQVELTINDPTAVDENGKPIRMIRRAETNMGDMCADAYRAQSGADIALVNGGGIRANISAGDVTLRDILSVHPYGNELCVVEATGQQILDALEWGAKNVPDESGGFQQVSGLTYEIHTYIESTCQSDVNGMFSGVSGERRVKNVMVDGQPIDPNKTYTVASHNYLLKKGGDGFSVFMNCKLVQDCVKLDNQVLIDYITQDLGGSIGEEYAELTGQGRITIVEQKP